MFYLHNFLLMKCEIFLDYPIDYHMNKDCFESKFLRNAKAINLSCVGLRDGLIEILEACARVCTKKLEKISCAHDQRFY